VVVTGSLESDRYESISVLVLLYLDERRRELLEPSALVYIDQTTTSTFWKVHEDHVIE
jgi:hypothetical protein